MGAKLADRRSRAHGAGSSGAGRAVVLGTLSCRIDPDAERMAIASALDAGSPLVVVNAVHLPNYPSTLLLVGPGGAVLPHEEDLEAVRAMAGRAASLGIPTQHFRVASKRPVKALLEVARDREAGLLVFGPDPARIGRRRLRRARRVVRRDAPCLVWTA